MGKLELQEVSVQHHPGVNGGAVIPAGHRSLCSQPLLPHFAHQQKGRTSHSLPRGFCALGWRTAEKAWPCPRIPSRCWSSACRPLANVGPVPQQLVVCVLGDHSIVPDSCDPMDCSPPGSSVHEILQASILEWVAISFSRASSQPRD